MNHLYQKWLILLLLATISTTQSQSQAILPRVAKISQPESALPAAATGSSNYKVDGISYKLITEVDTQTTYACVTKGSGETEDGVYSGNVVIPENVVISGVEYPIKKIDYSAFEDCPELVSVHIPKTVISIFFDSFEGSPKLKEITVDKENKILWSYDGCLYYKVQNANVVEGNEFMLIAVPEGKEGILEIPEAVRLAYIHSPMPRITAIKLPSTFMPVHIAYLNGPLLKSFEVSEKNPWLESRDGVLIQKKRLEKNEVSNSVYEDYVKDNPTVQNVPAILNFPSGKTIKQYTIPSDIVHLGLKAFYQCNNIEEVTIPENVIELGDSLHNST